MKMCDIIKELRALQRCGDKSEQTMAKRMLNNLYEENKDIKEVERITLLQYLMTFNCKYNGVYLKIKEHWNGVSCIVDLGHFNVVKTVTIFPTEALVKDDGVTYAPVELYNLYIDTAERKNITACYDITLTYKASFDNDRVKGETNGNND